MFDGFVFIGVSKLHAFLERTFIKKTTKLKSNCTDYIYICSMVAVFRTHVLRSTKYTNAKYRDSSNAHNSVDYFYIISAFKMVINLSTLSQTLPFFHNKLLSRRFRFSSFMYTLSIFRSFEVANFRISVIIVFKSRGLKLKCFIYLDNL